jgi:hypothetical protein
VDRSISETPSLDVVELTPEDVSSASHPAIARALDDILGDDEANALFSNFVSHSSATA